MNSLGVSFVPTVENSSQDRASEPVTEAIKYLSLRLPRVVGAKGISSDATMQPHITNYAGPGAIVDQAIKNALAAQGGVAGTDGGGGGTTTYPPNIIPGGGNQTPEDGSGGGIGGNTPGWVGKGWGTRR